MGVCLGEIPVGVSDATQHAFGMPDSRRIVDRRRMLQPLMHEGEGLVDLPMLMIGFPKNGFVLVLLLPRAILRGLLNNLLQCGNRLGESTLGQIGAPKFTRGQATVNASGAIAKAC